jgi:pimeloyl-ACP methyl ester carboxylesterase
VNAYNDIYFTSDDGLRLHARDYACAAGSGSGSQAKCPVICLHGLTRNASDFEELAPWIASQGRRVIVVDMRGRGLSAYDNDPAHYKLSQYAKDVIKLAHNLGIARAVFIGTSMGGLITLAVALRKLKLIAAAVLNDVGPVLSPKGLNRITSYTGKGKELATWTEASDYIMTINQTAFPDNTMDDWAKWARRAFTENAQGKLVLQYDPQIAQSVSNGKLKPHSWITKWAFRRLTRKRSSLLVRGELSDLLEPEQAQYMRAVAPAMRYVEVPRVGHAPTLTEPEAMNAIQALLDEVE